MRRLQPFGSVALAVTLLALGLAGCQPTKKGPPELVSVAGLFPTFQTAVTDYVNRCTPPSPTEVRVTAPDGTTVAVNGAAPQSGAFTVPVAQGVGQRFTIDVTTAGTTTTHHVRCLPTDFPNWLAVRSGTPQAAFYATALIEGPFSPSNYPAIFDTNGVPVWWLPRHPTGLLTPLGNGNLAITTNAGFQEYDLAGTQVESVNTVGPADNHDVILLPNGNYVMATAEPQPCDLSSWGIDDEETCINHVFQELNPEDGTVVWEWHTSAHISVDETTQDWRDGEPNSFLAPVFDPWHYNSVEDTGDGLIISFRHTDAVYKIDKATGEIVWKLGGTVRPTGENLTLMGDPLNRISGQHDARLHDDGSVTLFDNGTHGPHPDRQPRSVRYAIDTTAGTATLMDDARDGTILASFCCGSTRLLPGGNWVTGWGGTNQIAEYAPDGTPVFRLTTQFVYRGLPLLPGEFTIEDLRAGMDARV